MCVSVCMYDYVPVLGQHKKVNKHPPLSLREVPKCWRLSTSPRMSPLLL